jgi:hypothetical protein
MNVTVDQTGRERLARSVDRPGRQSLPRRPRMGADPDDAIALDEHTGVTSDACAVEEGDVGDVERPRHRQDTQGGTRTVPSSSRISFVPPSIVTTIVAPSGPASTQWS